LGYWLAAASLTREFDDLLRAKAASMAMVIEEEEGGHLDIDATDVFLREFEARVGAACFQLWDCSSNVVGRSKSPGGTDTRVATFKFKPRPTDDAKPPTVLTVAILAVALERKGLELVAQLEKVDVAQLISEI
jgi:hypothetical protein